MYATTSRPPQLDDLSDDPIWLSVLEDVLEVAFTRLSEGESLSTVLAWFCAELAASSYDMLFLVDEELG